MFSPQTTACTGPSNSALASLMTSSRDVHGGMWVNNNSPPRPALPSGRPRCPTGAGAAAAPGHGSRTPRTGTRRRRWPVRPANRTPGVPAVDQRRAAGIGDPQTVGLGGVGDQSGQHGQRAEPDGLTVAPVPDVEDVGSRRARRPPARTRPPAATRCRWARTGSPGPWRASGDTAATRTARQIQTVVGVQMRQQDVHLVGIGVALQSAEDTAPKSSTSGGVSGAVSKYPDAGESGPTTLPEQPRMVIRTATSLPCPQPLRGKHHQFAREILGRSLLGAGGARPAAHR